jgi:hypothetical protein
MLSAKKRNTLKAKAHARRCAQRAAEAQAAERRYVRSVTNLETVVRQPTEAEVARLTISRSNDGPRTVPTLTTHCCPKGHPTAFLKRGEECPRCIRLRLYAERRKIKEAGRRSN